MNRLRIFHRKQRLPKAKSISKLDATLKTNWVKKRIKLNYHQL